jgi:hypothetical protein
VQPFVAAQFDDHSEDRFGSKARITAPQHYCLLFLEQRICALKKWQSVLELHPS